MENIKQRPLYKMGNNQLGIYYIFGNITCLKLKDYKLARSVPGVVVVLC